MKMKTRNFAFEVKSLNDDGSFSGYGSMFGNVDSYNEVVAPGAFKASLKDWASKDALPSMLWQHDSTQPIGVYTSMKEDASGLMVEGRLLKDDVQKAAEAYALLKAKAISGLSIGFVTKSDQVDKKTGTRTLLDVDLWEVSLVTFPANTQARVDAVKEALIHGDLPSLPEFERFLREAGFSKSQATAIAGKGLGELLRSESGDTKSELAEILALFK